MNWLSTRQLALGAAAVLCASALAPAAQAQDFFSQLFGGFGRARAPQIHMPFAADDGPVVAPRREARPRYGVGQAYCVRSCDGRYFPVNGPDKKSRAEACDNFCPASDTKLVFGSSIDNAATETGKPYSELPNAFRYREELVAGCTCNGKDQIGLAPIKIDDDPTLRKGDIVAAADGLMVVSRRPDKRGASLNFSPASDRLQARYQRVPVMARE